MRIYGYVRTSKGIYNEENQEYKLSCSGVDRKNIFRDLGVSGARSAVKRDGWKELEGRLKEGDVVIVTELARLGRNMSDVMSTFKRVVDKGVRIRSLAPGEEKITEAFGEDDDSAITRFGRQVGLQMLVLFSEMELETLKRRTRDGLARAKAEGKVLGRPAPSGEKAQMARLMHAQGSSKLSIGRTLGVSPRTVRRWLE